MKRLLLLTLAAIPLFAVSVNFVYCDYDYYDDDYWYDEYWEDEYWCDGYWVYYPHGYYCVYYVWWYPWWWDYFWWRCHWCHHFSWDFFYCGFYIIWYDDGCWWFRPRYGRWVRYRLPYTYHEVWHRARQHGISLPKKPPREINISYKGKAIRELAKQRDPHLFSHVEKEHKTGKLEKMRKNYMAEMKKEITRKNQEHRIKKNDIRQSRSFEQKKHDIYTPSKRTPTNKSKRQQTRYQTEKNYPRKDSKSHIIKKERGKPNESERKREKPSQMRPDVKKKQNPHEYHKKSTKNEADKRHFEHRERSRTGSRSSKYKG